MTANSVRCHPTVSQGMVNPVVKFRIIVTATINYSPQPFIVKLTILLSTLLLIVKHFNAKFYYRVSQLMFRYL